MDKGNHRVEAPTRASIKHQRLVIILILLCSYNLTAVSQSLENFDDVLGQNKIGKVITKKVGKDISQRTLLGVVSDKEGKLKYYVVKEFLRIQAAIVYHGTSRVLFFDANKNLRRQVILTSNDELPFKLENNCLYFNFLEKDTQRVFVQPVQFLPKMICVQPKSCYDISKP